jgi:hypothetical protein
VRHQQFAYLHDVEDARQVGRWMREENLEARTLLGKPFVAPEDDPDDRRVEKAAGGEVEQ